MVAFFVPGTGRVRVREIHRRRKPEPRASTRDIHILMAYKFIILFLMYTSQKIFLCFSWAFLPIMMRKQGASLGSIGFTALIYSPWCLKFAYAWMVDRYYSTRIGRRKSWISPLLITSGIALPFLSQIPPEQNLKPLLAAVFVMNWIFATTDIAVDGYATDILLPEERPWGNAAQMTGYIIGFMLGAGVFLIVYQHRGWRDTLLIIAALQLVLIGPVIAHKEIPRVPATGPEKKPVDFRVSNYMETWSFMIKPKTLWFFLFSAMIVIVDRGGSVLRLPMLIDMGMEPAGLGRMNIWAGSPMSILGSIIGGMMINRTGVPRAFVIGCIGSSGLNFFSALVSRKLSSATWQAAILIGADKLLAGIVFIIIFSLIMDLSAGPNAATHYAILGSIVQSVGLVIMPVTGILCDASDYFHLYSWFGFFGFFTAFTGNYLLHRRIDHHNR